MWNTVYRILEDAMIHRSPLRDAVYREVLDRIHRGEIPAGSRVRDTALAGQLGVSRTPVREALLRLVGDGLLDADMGRGFTVSLLNPAEMRETGAILSSLECLALETSGDMAPEQLVRLSAIDQELGQTRGDVDRCIALDEEWHRTLLQGCPNQRLLSLIASLWQVPRRYMRAYLRDAGRLSLSTQHHARIVEALRRNDRRTALERFAYHWRRGIEELDTWMQR
jgi:DNA-binding GntR family transcriptional regulator